MNTKTEVVFFTMLLLLSCLVWSGIGSKPEAPKAWAVNTNVYTNVR